MIFSGSLFLFLFLPLFLIVYHAVPARLRTPWLLVASWVFYGWWRLDYLGLLLVVSAGAWFLGRGIAATRERNGARARVFLASGVALCVGALAYFKYTSFGIESLNSLLAVFRLGAVPAASIVLPVGISFSLFKAIAYLMDQYRGTAPGAGSWLDVSAYLALFPQVISGPIDRFGALVPQLHRDDRSWAGFAAGALRFMLGFCKKVLVADLIAPIANAAFGMRDPSFLDAWLGAAAYTMQLFFDFSGYSDMAIGLGGMMGLRFMENFRQPYLSASITEFWQRWHISLSSWLRDYLYIPLGGNRRGLARTCVNLLAVMLIGGLWHGAAFTFVLWGAWHGVLLLIERLRRDAPRAGTLPRPIAIALTMLLVVIGWVLFRAPSTAGAASMFAGMIGLRGLGLSPALQWQIDSLGLAALAAAWAGVYLLPWLSRSLPRIRTAAELATLPLFLLAVLKVVAESAPVFLYGKF
jgi:alginate O-acetyltransferase complex protein AlgI